MKQKIPFKKNIQVKVQVLTIKIKMMKTKVLMMAILTMMVAGTVSAKDKTEKFEVKGNCGMCEKRIEKAALSVEGVTLADWDKTTKQIKVVLDDSKTDVHKVHMAIAKAGHDTKMHKATDEAYNALPGCCQYDRSEEVQKVKE